MTIPTEPIGSIPRPAALIEVLDKLPDTDVSADELSFLIDTAVRDTLTQFESTGSNIVTDGEQGKYPDFATYPLSNLTNLSPDGLHIPDSTGYSRCLPRLTAGPFRYGLYADHYLERARQYTQKPLKQTIISPAILSLIYPLKAIPGYSREAFLEDLLQEHRTEIRRCLDKDAYKVQIDFSGAELAIKLDPAGELLNSFIYLNNLVLDNLTDEERKRIGVHLCMDSHHGSYSYPDVGYTALLPSLLELHAGNFYIALEREPDRARILQLIQDHLKPEQKIFIGVTDPCNPRIESPDNVKERIMEAIQYIPIEQLGTTDDSGFSPFAGQATLSRELAFEKIHARVAGTALANEMLG